MSFSQLLSGWRATVFVLAGLSMLPGCKKENPNSFENVRQRIEQAEAALEAAGVTWQGKVYPGIGTARSVNLSQATLGETTVEDLRRLAPISELLAADSQVNDAFLQQFVEAGLHSNLNVVDLSNTQVTNAAIEPLAEGSRYLQRLNVKGTQVTEAGLSEFQKARNSAKGIPKMTRNVRITK